MDALLERAYAALRSAAQVVDGILGVADPNAVLGRVGIPRCYLTALVDAGYLVPDHQTGVFRFADTIPRTRNVLVALDIPNIIASCTTLGRTFDASDFHARARDLGRVVFPYAFLDPRSASEALQQELARAGYDVVSCRALATAAGDPKSIVDQKLDAVVRRHLAWSALDVVLIASEDQNFLDLVQHVRDEGRTCVVAAVNITCSLARAADDILALDGGAIVTEHRWNPDVIIDDLEGLRALPAGDQASAVRRLELRAPLVTSFLRQLYLRRENMPTRMPAFATLMNHAARLISTDDRRFVTDDHLKAFLTALVNARIIVKHVEAAGTDDGRTWYTFDDHHPFFRVVIERGSR